MIRSFRDKTLERFFATGDGRRLSVQNTRRIANILRALDDASRPQDMNLPGFRFHALVGRDKGRYAVNASGNWRITFGWTEDDAVKCGLGRLSLERDPEKVVFRFSDRITLKRRIRTSIRFNRI